MAKRMFMVAILCVGSVLASEAELRVAFPKDYNKPDPKDRIEAAKKLDGSAETATKQMLAQMASREPDAKVRVEVFKVLCSCKDTDATLSTVIAQLIRTEKDREVTRQFVLAAANQPFKSAILKEAIGLASNLKYPEFYMDTSSVNTVNSGGSANTSSRQAREQAERQRRYYEDFLTAINTLTGEGFQANAESPVELKKWWMKYELQWQKKDADLRDKLKAEASAAKKAATEAKK